MLNSLREREREISVTNESLSVDLSKYTGYVYKNGSIIAECDQFVTEKMVLECSMDPVLVEASAILEGAKMDVLLKNFLKEGEDYKGLKKDLNEIIKANNMSDAELKSKGKGFMHICKRILQLDFDIGVALAPVNALRAVKSGIESVNTMNAISAVLGGASMSVAPVIIGGIVGTVVGFIINRLLRLLVDTVEFNTIKKDAEKIVAELRLKAKETENEALANKYRSEADRLQKAIDKYSNK